MNYNRQAHRDTRRERSEPHEGLEGVGRLKGKRRVGWCLRENNLGTQVNLFVEESHGPAVRCKRLTRVSVHVCIFVWIYIRISVNSCALMHV
jgi:hypothetical protein